MSFWCLIVGVSQGWMMNFLPISHTLHGLTSSFQFQTQRRKRLFPHYMCTPASFLHRYSNINGSLDNRCWAMSGLKTSPCRPASKCAQVSRTVFWHHPIRTHPQQILQGHWRHRHDDPHEREGIPYVVFPRHLYRGRHSNQYTVGTIDTCTIRFTLLFYTGIHEIATESPFSHFLSWSSRDVLIWSFLCAWVEVYVF